MRVARERSIAVIRRPPDIGGHRGATDERREIVDAVSSLPDVQRDAVWLRYASGLNAREIGHVLGKSEEAIQKQIQRALGTLREVLD